MALRPSARAKRFTLRLTSEGDAVLTLPRGIGEREARDFLDRHSGWLTAAQARLPRPERVRLGISLPIDGVMRKLTEGEGARIRLEGARLELPRGADPAHAIPAWMKRQARARISPMALEYAETLGREVSAIAFRDTRSRWGSCSAAGRLSFSWRLVMAPEEVQRYLAAHEAAHLVEMNHSPRYWAVLASLMPDYRRPQAWLKREGRSLHRYRFE